MAIAFTVVAIAVPLIAFVLGVYFYRTRPNRRSGGDIVSSRDHITEEKVHRAMQAQSDPVEWERLLSELELHIRECRQCHKQFLPSVRAVRLLPPGEVLLNLSPENDRWNKMALGLNASADDRAND